MCKDTLAEVHELIFFFFYLLLSIHLYGTAENTNTIINGKEGSGVVLLTMEAGAYSYSKWVLFYQSKGQMALAGCLQLELRAAPNSVTVLVRFPV